MTEDQAELLDWLAEDLSHGVTELGLTDAEIAQVVDELSRRWSQ